MFAYNRSIKPIGMNSKSGVKMNPSQKKGLQEVLEHVMQHPLTNMAHDYESEDGQQRFGLLLVLNDLNTGVFQKAEQVFEAIDNVWEQCIPIIDAEVYGPMYAAECRRIVAKEKARLGFVPQKVWGEKVHRLRSKVVDSLAQPTRIISKLVDVRFVNPRMEKPDIPLITEREYDGFITAAESLPEEIVEEMRGIILEFEPELLKSGKDINIAEMKLETFRAVEAFAKKKFAERGECYPV